MDIEQTEDEEFSFTYAISDETLEGAGNVDILASFSLGLHRDSYLPCTQLMPCRSHRTPNLICGNGRGDARKICPKRT